MQRTPDETACDRVRNRLPLVAAEDDRAPGEAGDDRRAVEAHLAACEPCRARRDGLARALEALQAAAAESPVEPHAPSLWPALQARIAAREEAPRPRKAADRPRPRKASSRPTPAPAAPAGDRLLRPLLTGPVGALAAAALLALFVGLPLADRAREESAAQIRSALSPLPPAARPLVVAPARPEPPSSSDSPESADLALLDAPPLLDPEGRALDVPRPTPPPATPPAVRFDLDRGIPMPPDARVARPAY